MTAAGISRFLEPHRCSPRVDNGVPYHGTSAKLMYTKEFNAKVVLAHVNLQDPLDAIFTCDESVPNSVEETDRISVSRGGYLLYKSPCTHFRLNFLIWVPIGLHCFVRFVHLFSQQSCHHEATS